MPEIFNIDGDSSVNLESKSGTIIAKGYNRIVIGDYGASIEITKEQIYKNALCVKKGEEYRYKSDCKIYFQQKRVSYADYKVGMFYISPYELNTIKNRTQ